MAASDDNHLEGAETQPPFHWPRRPRCGAK